MMVAIENARSHTYACGTVEAVAERRVPTVATLNIARSARPSVSPKMELLVRNYRAPAISPSRAR